MRILIVGLNYSPEVVGIGPYTTELAEHFASRGHLVSVLTGFPYYPHWKIDRAYRRRQPFLVERINGVRVIRSPILLPGPRQGTFRRILFDSSLAVTALIASVRTGRVDLVICVSPPLQLGLTAWLVARSKGAQLWLQLQDLVPDAALSLGMMHEGAAVNIARRLENFVYARANRIAVISRGFFDNLVTKGVAPEKLRLLPNWVETGKFNAQPDAAIRASLGAANGEMLAIHSGNMGAKQGLETVISAAAELAGENVVVALIGDGNHRPRLEAQATRLGLQNLKFLPLQADLPATLAAADVLVLSQRRDVIDSVAPSKLLSYMAAGKPVVAAVNESCEASRMIREATCGIVVPPEDPAALAAAIRRLCIPDDQFAPLGASGRRYVVEYHEQEKILRQWSLAVEAQVG